MNKVIIKSSIYTLLTLFLLKATTILEVIASNKLALLQFENYNLAYTLYKFASNSGGTIKFVILLVGIYLCYNTINKYLKNKSQKGCN